MAHVEPGDAHDEDRERREQEHSEEMHRQNNPHYFPDPEFGEPDEDSADADDDEWQMECPYCDGDGCHECDGTGWY